MSDDSMTPSERLTVYFATARARIIRRRYHQEMRRWAQTLCVGPAPAYKMKPPTQEEVELRLDDPAAEAKDYGDLDFAGKALGVEGAAEHVRWEVESMAEDLKRSALAVVLEETDAHGHA